MIRTSPLLVFLFILASCSSGRKSLEQGDYQTAFYQSVKRLGQSPNNRRALETLASAYPELVSYNLDRIDRLMESNDPLRWEEIARLYAQLNQAYEAVQRSPRAQEILYETNDYTREYEDARLRATEARYALGESLMQAARQRDREAAKTAYQHYQKAAELDPYFRDVRKKSEEALYLATLWVQVNPIPIHSRALELSNEFFQHKVLEYLRSHRISEYVRFISRAESQAMEQEPDQYLNLTFDDFVIGRSAIRETVHQRKADSVVVGTVEVVEKGEKVIKDVYGTVQAEVHWFEKQVESAGLLDLQIEDNWSGQVVAQEKFSGTHIWIDYWGFFNGDERALTEEDRSKLRKTREVMPPPPQQLFVDFTAPIYDQLIRYLDSYYRYF